MDCLCLQKFDCHSICGYDERVLIFFSFFLSKNNFQENIILIAFIIKFNKLILQFQKYNKI